ncbi:jg9339 [Pararge aegeria aegeria]|uniref:Jg9339 protein n=1 Tax=Pararge aegeria aegeria TaxID=348720 RepID=A0A8S4S1D0_9NEOP|nr:jg9339 [Pararge aegeria aegeria]
MATLGRQQWMAVAMTTPVPPRTLNERTKDTLPIGSDLHLRSLNTEYFRQILITFKYNQDGKLFEMKIVSANHHSEAE